MPAHRGDPELTPRQNAFCIEYLRDLNGAQAYIRAGYAAKNANVDASKLLASASISQKIASLQAIRLARVEIDGDRVLGEIRNISESNVARMFKDDGTFKDIKDMDPEVQRVIASLEVEELWTGTGKNRTWIGYTKKVKLWSKDKALELLARHKSLLNDKINHEHTGKDGGPIEIEETAVIARIEAILEGAAKRLPSTIEDDYV